MNLGELWSVKKKYRGWKQWPTVDELRALMSYDPDTGKFVWLRDRKGGVRAGEEVGFSDGNGYAQCSVKGIKVRLHRLAWFYVFGELPRNDIDHINGDRSDNRLCNLRDVHRRINAQNQRTSKSGASGLLGVSPRGSRFIAQITTGGKHMSLGRFDTAQEAHEAYVKAKRELHEGCTL